MFKGQDSCVCLEAVSSGAEVVVDGPGAIPLLLCLQTYGRQSDLVEIKKFVLHTFWNI